MEYPGHVVAVTGFVRDQAGQILLVRVRDRGWEMPGGQVELGEDLPSALAREVEEESGCRVEVERLIGVYSKLTEPSMVLLLLRCAYLGGETHAQEDAVPEVGWFSRDWTIREAGPSEADALADPQRRASSVWEPVGLVTVGQAQTLLGPAPRMRRELRGS